MSKLSSDTATPLDKFDIVQVVLNASKVAEAKCDKRHVACPVNLFFPLNHL